MEQHKFRLTETNMAAKHDRALIGKSKVQNFLQSITDEGHHD